MSDIMRPADIERRSMEIITRELEDRGIALPEEAAPVVKRVIHATADFDFAELLRFSKGALAGSPLSGSVLVTDTNMALSGVSKKALSRLGSRALCFMAEEEVAREALRRGVTRAAVAVEYALSRYPGAVMAVGNAPTALLRLSELMEEGARPALVIAVPVGFVNVEESKKRIWEACQRFQVPAIVSFGRKGGSTVAAAICNALLYSAAGLEDPTLRMN